MVRIDFSRLRFLVVDDNVHMRQILHTLLHGFGAREIWEAEDGAAGLEVFTHNVPDIVITDWAMPIFNGIELTQMIRQPGANPNPYAPIIMLSAYTEKTRVMAARTPASPNSWPSRSQPRRSTNASSMSSSNRAPSSRPKPISVPTAGAPTMSNTSAPSGAKAARRICRKHLRCSTKPRRTSDAGI